MQSNINNRAIVNITTIANACSTNNSSTNRNSNRRVIVALATTQIAIAITSTTIARMASTRGAATSRNPLTSRKTERQSSRKAQSTRRQRKPSWTAWRRVLGTSG